MDDIDEVFGTIREKYRSDRLYQNALEQDRVIAKRQRFQTIKRFVKRLSKAISGLLPRESRDWTVSQWRRFYDLGDCTASYPEGDLREFGVRYCYFDDEYRTTLYRLFLLHPEAANAIRCRGATCEIQFILDMMRQATVEASLCKPGEAVSWAQIPFWPNDGEGLSLNIGGVFLTDRSGEPVSDDVLERVGEKVKGRLPEKTIGGLPITCNNLYFNLTALPDVAFWEIIAGATESEQDIELHNLQYLVYCDIRGETFRVEYPDKKMRYVSYTPHSDENVYAI